MSSPKKRMVPEESGKSPVTQLNSVVLPAPLEPSTARRSPGRTVMVTSVSAASAPNIRVTPRSSSAAPAPTAEMRWATLSMATTSVRTLFGSGNATTPALPETDHAVRGPEYDDEKTDSDQEAKAIAVEADLDQEVERKGAQDDENKRTDEGPHRPSDAADHVDDQDVDATFDRDGAWRDLPIVPDLEHASERRDQGREGVGGNPMCVDVEAKRGHSTRIVSHALQCKAERRTRDIEHCEVAERGRPEDHVIEGNVGAPVDTPEMRGRDGVNAGVAVEDRPVLIGEVIEGRTDRERDHDGVDAFGAHCQRATERAEGGGEGDRHRGCQPPRPAQADIGATAHAEHRNHVARKSRDGELHQADHSAIAREEHQAERNDTEDQRGAEDFNQEEAVGD